MPRLTIHLKEECRKLHLEGLSFSAIGKKLGISHRTAGKYCEDIRREYPYTKGIQNKYTITNETVDFELNDGKFHSLISLSDFDKISSINGTWYAKAYGVNMYAVINTKIEGIRKNLKMHVVIMGKEDGKVVDHRDGNGLNNKQGNLRLITKSQNNQNRNGAASNSKSGIRGVSWSKISNKWKAQYALDGVVRHIGFFDNIEDAEHAVIEIRRKYMPFSEMDI